MYKNFNQHIPINILIVDDDDDDYLIISDYIKGISNGFSYNIGWCPTYKEAMQELLKRKYNVYIVDYYLGAKTGLDFIKEAINNNCEEPIVLLTGMGNPEIDMMAMKYGAADYLVKGELTTEKLERSIRYTIDRYDYLKALKSNEKKFRTIFEKSKDCVFLADENFIFKDVNQAGTDLFGYTTEELTQISLYKLLVNAEEQQSIENALKKNEELIDYEVDLLTKNNEKVNCIISISKEGDINGNRYFQGMIHDISNLKKAEMANLQTEKFKASERLVRTLAHEIRNPLNNINLSVEELVSESKTDESAIFLEIINRNSGRIEDLITQLLDISQPKEIAIEKISLQSVMDESIAAAIDRIRLKKINLKTNYCDEPAYIIGDAVKLSIAFLNIIINAIEAMNNNDGALSIDIKDDDAKYIVSISDTGIGISEENISKLFEPYYTSKHSGMGWGLASSLNIIQSHKAHITVESDIHAGTTFIITFEKSV